MAARRHDSVVKSLSAIQSLKGGDIYESRLWAAVLICWKNLLFCTDKFFDKAQFLSAGMIVERNIYLKKLIVKRRNGKIKIVTGIRRCGKSFFRTLLSRTRVKIFFKLFVYVK